jgi:tetratricopeptide (TPR) repeat protein
MKIVIAFIAAFVLIGCTSTKTSESTSTISLFKKAERSYMQGLLSEAEADYIKLSRIAPDVSEVWLKLGNIYVRTGYLDAAIRMYKSCLDIEPKETRCWNNMALARVKQAMETLEAGTKNVEANSDDYYVLTELYEKLVGIIAVKER